MLEHIDPGTIADLATRALVLDLLNLLNSQAVQLPEQATEIQRLRDEINRLKGEQPRPRIKPPGPPRPPRLSSEVERRTPTARRPRPKQAELTVTREEICPLDRAALPADAEFKGYEDVLVQDLRSAAETIR